MLLWLAVVLAMSPAQAAMTSIVVDHATGEVLLADDPDEANYPASLTKMMTLYLLFEAMRDDRVRPSTLLKVSRKAASMPPTKLGLRPGQTIRVSDAISALAVQSANDVAVVIAENLGGSEQRFAQLMTRKARQLGLLQTRFMNASGLPNELQRTTARDIAILARRVILDFPKHYHYFGQESFTWKGRTRANHNRLMFSYSGMDGLKTGYIRASGYNLAASAVRGNRRLLGVVLGGPTAGSRNEEMRRVLDAAFEVKPRGNSPLLVARGPAASDLPELNPRSTVVASLSPQLPPAASLSARPIQRPEAVRNPPARSTGSFGVQLGAFKQRATAVRVAQQAKGKNKILRDGEIGISRSRARQNLYVAQIVGLERREAQSACTTLRRQRQACLVTNVGSTEIGSD